MFLQVGAIKQTPQLGIALTLSAILLSCLALLAIPTAAGAATAGGLKQLEGTTGCLVNEASSLSGCQDVRAMQNATDVVVSPDGRNVYVSSLNKDAIVSFDRNPSTGALTQKGTITGCVTSNPGVSGPDQCNLISNAIALDGVTAMAISPDGKSLYTVTNQGKASAFNRAPDGTLTYLDTDTCCSQAGATTVAVSPDGASVYAAGDYFASIVVWFTRNTVPGPNFGNIDFSNCYGNGGGCLGVQNMAHPTAVTVTPDNGELVISTSDGVVLGWDRASTGATIGALTPSFTPSRCVANSTLSGTCQAKTGTIALMSEALVGNTRIYAGGQQAVSTINRDPSTNNIAPDTAGNCFGYPGSNFLGCANMPGSGCCSTFYPARELVGTPDGRNLYLGTESAAPAIFGFNRSDAALSPMPPPLHCLSAPAADTCAGFRQGNRIQAMAASPDSRNIYAVGNNRLFAFAVDRAPVCQNVSTSTTNNSSVTVNLSCSDPDGDALTYEKVTEPSRGTLAGVQGNSVSYGPQPGTTGADSFQYRALGAGIASDPATATIDVTYPPLPVTPISRKKCKKGFVKKTVKIRRHGKVVKDKNGKAKTKTICVKRRHKKHK